MFSVEHYKFYSWKNSRYIGQQPIKELVTVWTAGLNLLLKKHNNCLLQN